MRHGASVTLAALAAACAHEPSGPATPRVSAIAGDGQTALIGYPTNVRPAVRVLTAGAPAVGVAVTFAVTAGGGAITGPTTLSTDANGVAQVGGWVVGATPGTNVLTATAAGAGTVTFSAQAVAPSFHLVVQNVGPPLSAAVQAALDSAAAFWQRVVYVGLPPVSGFADTANACGKGFPAFGPATISDMVIQVRFDSIDGPGKILGRSGPCYVRAAPDNRTVLGTMLFDTADVATLVSGGYLDEVVLHEMAHVLGFGTLWGAGYFGCLQLPSSGGSNPPDTYYSCAQGRAAFDSIGGTSYTGGNKVPLENCFGISGCGAGTYNSHWRKSVFFNELLTGYLSTGTTMPLSVLTIAAIGDLGYTVNYGAAQSYSRVFTSVRPPPEPRAQPAPLALGDDIEHRTIRRVDRNGNELRR